MTGKRKAAIGVGTAVSVAMVGVCVFLIIRHRPTQNPPALVTGVVLVDDTDPKKQAPLANAAVVATAGSQEFHTTSDPSGLFNLTIPRNTPPPFATISLRVTLSTYQPAELAVADPDRIHIVRLVPSVRPAPAPLAHTILIARPLRVRYSERASVTTNIGSVVKTFGVENKGNVPCVGRAPCSPDGKWKAAIGAAVLEAQQGTEFSNVRVSCIAGPCPFSKLESEQPTGRGKDLKISVRNWSDTVTYLLEAEVRQTRLIEVVREAYPAVFGPSMNFTLPPAAQGPSIEAEVGGRDIIYPLGPDLILSWAVCTVQVAADNTKLFHCDLKPGYSFQ